MEAHIKEFLKQLGFSGVDRPMAQQVGQWWEWYTATADWYSSTDIDTNAGRTYKVERLTIKPARMVCQEFASLILSEGTAAAAEDETTDEFLQAWMEETDFWPVSQGVTERAMALGTAGWALRVENVQVSRVFRRVVPSERVRVIPERYDARHIVPLTYDSRRCSECLFISSVVERGKQLTQAQAHVLNQNGTYRIETAFFDDKGRRVELESVLPTLETGSTKPLFGLARPALENSYEDYSPFGVSVFDDAIGAVKLTDAAVDNMYRDIWLGQKMLFLDERMLTTDSNNNIVVPRAQDQQLFRKTEAGDVPGGSLIDEYNPDLRVEDNRTALRTALIVLGERTGLGADYFDFESRTTVGPKTATEVMAEDNDLFRTVKKHERALERPIVTVLQGALELYRTIGGISLPESDVHMLFDDSIFEDTASKRKRDLEDVASGLMKPWEYRMKWYGEDEETAKAMTTFDELPPEE